MFELIASSAEAAEERHYWRFSLWSSDTDYGGLNWAHRQQMSSNDRKVKAKCLMTAQYFIEVVGKAVCIVSIEHVTTTWSSNSRHTVTTKIYQRTRR